MIKKNSKLLFVVVTLVLSLVPGTLDAIYKNRVSRNYAENHGRPLTVFYRSDGGEITEYYGDGLYVESIYPLTDINDPVTRITNEYMNWPSFFLLIFLYTIKYWIFSLVVYFCYLRIIRGKSEKTS